MDYVVLALVVGALALAGRQFYFTPGTGFQKIKNYFDLNVR